VETTPVELTADIRLAAARLSEHAEADRTALTLAAHGTAQLVMGQIQPAIEALEEAIGLDVHLGFAWSDLSAAYLARNEATGVAADIPRALDAAERALAVDPPVGEARFNRALALERLGLLDRASEAWRDAAGYERDRSPWGIESLTHHNDVIERQRAQTAAVDLQTIRERLFDEVLPRWAALASTDRAGSEAGLAEAAALIDRLQHGPADRLAADTLARIRAAKEIGASDRASLLRGHSAYGRARGLYKRDQMDAAGPAFDEAMHDLGQARSPLELSARLYHALVAYRRRDLARAEQTLVALLPLVQAAGYTSLVGRTAWTLGVLATQRGAYVEAAGRYRLALSAFDDAREHANRAFVHMLLADNFDRRGEPERGWNDRLLALAGSRREGTLLTSAQSALRLDWPYVASVLQDEAVALARSERRLTNVVDALRSQAQTCIRLGQFETAARLIGDARVLLADQHDSTWDRLRAEVNLVDAQRVAASPPGDVSGASTIRAAIDAATGAHDYFVSSSATRRLPDVLLSRARLHRIAGALDAARADLSRAVDILIAERNALAPGAERMAFAETARRVGDEVVSLEVAAGRIEPALLEADRLRSWDLDTTTRTQTPLDLARLRTVLPEDTRIIYYALGDRDAFAWVISRAGVRLQRLHTDRAEMQRLVTALRPKQIDSPAMRRLYEIALRPFVETLAPGGRMIVVPDGPLHALAFVALPGRRARYLVEEQVLSQAPSLSALVGASRRLRAFTSDIESVVAVGNPRLDPTTWPALPDLRGAAEEARSVAARYPTSQLLIAAQATREALVAALATADVLHFAGHAIINDLYPEDSQLAIPSRDGQPLTAAALRTVDWPRLRLAVLAACESAGGRSMRGQGPMSLARALLQAQVPAVLASRWLVSDRAAVTLATTFHDAYRHTPDAAAALQRAQVSMIHSSDASLRDPAAWAGWTLIGGTPRLGGEPIDSRPDGKETR
jgi:CHAT domain-containing protein